MYPNNVCTECTHIFKQCVQAKVALSSLDADSGNWLAPTISYCPGRLFSILICCILFVGWFAWKWINLGGGNARSLERVWSKYFSQTIFHSSQPPLPSLVSLSYLHRELHFPVLKETGSKGCEVHPWKIKTPQDDLWSFRGWSWWRSIVTHETGRTGWWLYQLMMLLRMSMDMGTLRHVIIMLVTPCWWQLCYWCWRWLCMMPID